MFTNNAKNVLQKVARSVGTKSTVRSFASKKDNNRKHAVVSGKSITGMMSALNLQKEGYEVDV